MMHYKVPVGNRFMELSFEELYAIGTYWLHQCDREEIESAVDVMQDEYDLSEVEDMDELIEFCAREYRECLDGSSQDQYNFDRAQRIVREYLQDNYDLEV